MLREIADPKCDAISILLQVQLNQVVDEYAMHTDCIEEILARLTGIVKRSVLSKTLLNIPGIGVINATAITSAIGNGAQFRNGREFAVWLGLTPRQSGCPS